jgi:predicted sulfurtransferase
MQPDFHYTLVRTMKRYSLTIPIAVIVTMACAQERKAADGTVTPAEVARMMAKDSNVVVLDVRTEAEFESETGHLKGASLIPVQELEESFAASVDNR